MADLKEKYLVTAALPYANGRLHVGHVAGAYLPADICVRFLRLTGREVHFVCGSDENGVPITLSAMKEEVDPQVIIDRYSPQLESAFRGLGIDFDVYGRTHTPAHAEVAQAFFLRLHEEGHIQSRTSEQVYCTECEMYLPDRYIEGVCHHEDCGAAGARGDQCEKCGRPIDATLLGEPECVICRQLERESRGHIEVRETTHWYFRLDAFEQDLRAYVDAHPEWRETVKRFSYGLLEQGLRERSVTRDLDWGVPVPLAEAEGKVLYVWFDAPIGYITFSREHFAAEGDAERWREFWCSEEHGGDPTAGLLHFIGKDNTVFHSVIFPGMLIAHGDFRPADEVVANEFLNLEGDKLSTSRNYAVWVDEYLGAFPADPLRYYLTANAPEAADSDFVWADFLQHNNAELADNLGNFIQRTLGFCAKYFDGRAPAPAGGLSESGEALMAEIRTARGEIADCLSGHRYRAGIERLMKLSQRGNQFFAEETPWKSRKTDMDACARTMLAALRMVEALSVLMVPFLPFAAEKLRTMLNLPAPAPGAWDDEPGLPPGQELGAPEVLFPKMEPDAIRPFEEALAAARQS